jgi:hypothetical protein
MTTPLYDVHSFEETRIHYKGLKCHRGIDILIFQSNDGLIFLPSQVAFAMNLLHTKERDKPLPA